MFPQNGHGMSAGVSTGTTLPPRYGPPPEVGECEANAGSVVRVPHELQVAIAPGKPIGSSPVQVAQRTRASPSGDDAGYAERARSHRSIPR